MTTATQRVEDLLVQHATEGLAPELERELARLLPDSGATDRETFLLAAAAVELTYTDDDEPLPDSLRQQVSDQARTFYGSRTATTSPTQAAPKGRLVAFPTTHEPAPAVEIRQPWAGWAVAAAAMLVATLGWWPRLVGPAPTQVAPTQIASAAPPSTPTPVVLTAAEARQALIARSDDLLQLTWTATDDPAATGASGDVVWSPTEQQGFLRFVDLAVNDPTREQYQLWIFDSAQDERYPVDGGVFDVASTGEVIIPIDPKLRVLDATLFAITVEKPGGVVVSSRERLPLLAQVG